MDLDSDIEIISLYYLCILVYSVYQYLINEYLDKLLIFKYRVIIFI